MHVSCTVDLNEGPPFEVRTARHLVILNPNSNTTRYLKYAILPLPLRKIKLCNILKLL